METAEETHERLSRLPFYEAALAAASKTLQRQDWAKRTRAVADGGFAMRPVGALGPCPPASAVAASVRQVGRVLHRYYEEYSVLSGPRKLATTLRDAMPTLGVPKEGGGQAADPDQGRPGLGGWVLDHGLWLIGSSRGDMMAFLSDPCPGGSCAAANRWTMGYLVESATFCEFESVTFCSDYRRDLWTSAVLGLLLYMGVYAVMEVMGLAWVGAAAFYLLPLFVVWFSVGVSPRCLPMVPTCLLDAVVDTGKALVPASASIPPALLTKDGTAVRSCAGMGLDAWYDPLVFGLCDVGLCDGWSNTSRIAGVEVDVGGKRAMQASPDAAAYRVCAGVMAVNTAGAALVGVVVIALGWVGVGVLTGAAAPLASLVWQVVVYDHN